LKHETITLPKLDCEEISKEIYDFIRKTVVEARANGAVVGLSGGVDSSLAVTLCVNALGREKVLGILMPTNFTPKQDTDDAKKLAMQLGIRTVLINIEGVCGRIFENLGIDRKDRGQRMPMANIYARTRMIVLYYHANLGNFLVVGPGDRSEALIGFFTKYGDGGADLFPIMHLYKTQVRKLTEYLGVPEKIAYKPSSPQLYLGHKATDEIPLDYDRLDPVLVGLFDLKLQPKEVSRLTDVPVEVVEEVIRRFNVSKHKRMFPPSVRGV